MVDEILQEGKGITLNQHQFLNILTQQLISSSLENTFHVWISETLLEAF